MMKSIKQVLTNTLPQIFVRSYTTTQTGKKEQFALFCFFVTLFANFAALHLYHYLTERTAAIVLQPSVTAKSTPSDSGTDLFVIHEGRKVKISDDSMQGWKEIELEDGNIGWVPAESIERI